MGAGPFSFVSIGCLSAVFPRKGDIPHFLLVLAKSNQSPRSIHGVNPEASPLSMSYLGELSPAEITERINIFVDRKKMKTKVKGNHVMG